MTQYLLSVWHGELDTPPEDFEGIFEAVDKFNADVMASGAWVFGGGLEQPDTATVVDATKGGDATMTDGPSAACRNAVEVRPFQAES